MRRLAAAAGVLLLLAALLVLGWNRWPGANTASTSSLAAATALPGTAAMVATTTAPPSTTTSIATTTTSPPPGIAVAEIPTDQARPSEFFGALLALSTREAWAVLWTDALDEDGTDLIGHIVDGSWTLYALSGADWTRVMGLARAPDGTVWAATDMGVYSFDGDAWVWRYRPAGGVAVGADGAVWAGGKLTNPATGLGSLWLARWDGGPWERLDGFAEEPLEPWGQAPIGVLASGEAWIAHRPGYWVEEDLTHYDGTAMAVVDIPGVPDATPDNAQPAVRVFEVEADPDGRLWAVGYLASDPRQAALARFDGADWTLIDWPFAPPTALPLDIDLAAGPDGVMWFACNEGLRSYDGATWQSHLEGRLIYNVAVAPDGTVWYSDETGVHPLEAP
jgi:hypothetical protein